jgi:hypothetical protein
MKYVKKTLAIVAASLVALVVGYNLWGYLTLGTISPDPDAGRDSLANRVVMVFGATGSAGDGLLKAAIEDPNVEKVHVVTRRASPRIDTGVASGKVMMYLHEDFTDYSSMLEVLPEVNTVLWGLGTSSLKVDEDTYTKIHVDFPLSFIRSWLSVRTDGPMAFHFVTGMGTGADESARWARDKARTETEMAKMAEDTGLRTFSYRSAYIRPTAEQSNALSYFGEWIMRPGNLVVTATDLGRAMLEISARTQELANGTLIDNADTNAFAEAYKQVNK